MLLSANSFSSVKIESNCVVFKIYYYPSVVIRGTEIILDISWLYRYIVIIADVVGLFLYLFTGSCK